MSQALQNYAALDEAADSQRKRGNAASLVRSVLIALAGLGVLLLLWWAGAEAVARNPRTASFAGFAPDRAIPTLISMIASGAVLKAFIPSITRIGLGLFWAIAIGVPMGILLGRSGIVRNATYLPFQLLRMISPLAWMPVAILVFPTWDGAIVFLITAAAVWPITFATAAGLAKVDPDWFKVAHNLGAGFWHLLTVIVVPAIAQDILTGIRLALGVAWIVLVPAEFLGVTSGLGYAINDARDTLEYDRLAAIILVIGVIGFVLDGFLLWAIRRSSWTRQS